MNHARRIEELKRELAADDDEPGQPLHCVVRYVDTVVINGKQRDVEVPAEYDENGVAYESMPPGFQFKGDRVSQLKQLDAALAARGVGKSR